MNYFKCLKENFSQWTLSCVNIYMPLEDKELSRLETSAYISLFAFGAGLLTSGQVVG